MHYHMHSRAGGRHHDSGGGGRHYLSDLVEIGLPDWPNYGDSECPLPPTVPPALYCDLRHIVQFSENSVVLPG